MQIFIDEVGSLSHEEIAENNMIRIVTDPMKDDISDENGNLRVSKLPYSPSNLRRGGLSYRKSYKNPFNIQDSVDVE